MFPRGSAPFLLKHLVNSVLFTILIGRSPTPNRVFGAVFVVTAGYMVMLGFRDIEKYYPLRKTAGNAVRRSTALLGREEVPGTIREISGPEDRGRFSDAVIKFFQIIGQEGAYRSVCVTRSPGLKAEHFGKTIYLPEELLRYNPDAQTVFLLEAEYAIRKWHHIQTLVAEMLLCFSVMLIAGLLVISRPAGDKKWKKPRSRKKASISMWYCLVMTLFIITLFNDYIWDPSLLELESRQNELAAKFARDCMESLSLTGRASTSYAS